MAAPGEGVDVGEGETGSKVVPQFLVGTGSWLQCHSRWTGTGLGGKIVTSVWDTTLLCDMLPAPR